MGRPARHAAQVIANVYLHLINELPIVAEVFELPQATDLTIRCTNVATVDGKRPQFVHDSKSMFIIPLSVIRLMEAPPDGALVTSSPGPAPGSSLPALGGDDEPDEEFLARIRDV